MTQSARSAHTRTTTPDGQGALRLRLKDETTKTGYVDGAWWPRNADLTPELPAVLAAAEKRLGAVQRVVYRQDEWTPAPARISVDGRLVRLDSRRHGTAHTIELLGDKEHRLVLLVIPPEMDPGQALAVMTSAAALNSEAAVEELLSIARG